MNVTIRPGVDFYRPLSFFLHAMDLTLSHLTLCLEAKKTGKIAKIAVPGRSWQSRNLISNATIDDGDESGSMVRNALISNPPCSKLILMSYMLLLSACLSDCMLLLSTELLSYHLAIPVFLSDTSFILPHRLAPLTSRLTSCHHGHPLPPLPPRA